MRKGLLAIIVVGAAVAATAAFAVVRLTGQPSANASASPGQSAATAKVSRMTLTESVAVDGMLSFGPSLPVDARAQGTLTWLPDVGKVLKRGDVLLRADEVPVVLLYGSVPMFRTLTVGAVGRDVAQFEANLRALRYSGFPVDQTYTAETAAAVKRWQHRLGVPETGTVDLAAVVFAPGAIRIDSHAARLGASATGTVLTYTEDTKVVTAQVPAQNATWATTGTKVDVVLPSGSTVAGSVTGVGREASSQSGSDSGGTTTGDTVSATVTVTVALADQGSVSGLDRAPVKVRHISQQRTNVLTVPVAALIAPIEGGYAVEVVNGDSTSIVPVQTGLFADGRVEITGSGIADGMSVRVPA